MASENRMKELFANIAKRYDRMNRIMSFGMDLPWRRRAARAMEESYRVRNRINANLLELVRRSHAAAIEPDDKPAAPSNGLASRHILDLACGTCDSSFAIMREAGFQCAVTGLDLSPDMLRIALAKAEKKRIPAIDAFSKAADKTVSPKEGEIVLKKGSAMCLPFARDVFSGAVCEFGFRNFPETERPLKELRRVVKPGGRLVVLEFFRPRSFVKRAVVNSWLAATGFFAGAEVQADYSHLRKSITTIGDVSTFIRTAEKCHWQLLRFDEYFPVASMLIFK